jgi:hypothetical protein
MPYAAIRDVAEKPDKPATSRRVAEPDRGRANRKDWRDRILNVLIAVLLIEAAVIFLILVGGLAYMALN